MLYVQNESKKEVFAQSDDSACMRSSGFKSTAVSVWY